DATPHASQHEAAYRQLLIAEGSDWFWWFGSRHQSGVDAAWDALFRSHLRRVYELIDAPAPAQLDEEILSGAPPLPAIAPLRAIHPRAGNDPEWRAAGIATHAEVFAAMQPSQSSVSAVRFGASGASLHLRLGDAPPAHDGGWIDVAGAAPTPLEPGAWTVDVKLPAGPPASFAVRLVEAGRGEGRIPESGVISVPATRGVPIALLAAECSPFAVAGGLAEQVAAAAVELARSRDCVVIIPAHGGVLGPSWGVRIPSLTVRFGQRAHEVRVLQAQLGDAAVLAIDSPEHFLRRGIYDEPDDGERYLFFCQAAVEVLAATALGPEEVHGYEWESAAALALLRRAAPGVTTVFIAGEPGVRHQVPARLLAAAGLRVAGDDTVDLFDLGRRSETRSGARSTPRI
ncbi:MAG TPA: glycogen/starch synthase, partial [Candidatus Dormibacteraeota bacterium]|nr:glycogen/starch synthase [Candidatus Dormibacteraeota bacterium]